MRDRRTLPLRLAAALALGAALSATPLAAQKGSAVPQRPRLEAGADTNDADAYYEYGVRPNLSMQKAQDAFYWAYRLDPRQTAYLLLQWEALWLKQSTQFRQEYRAGAEYALKSKQSRQLDSLLQMVMIRNPFTHLTATVCSVPSWIGELRDPLAEGSVYYDSGCYKQAADKYGEALAKRPGLVGLRVDRARALHFSGANGTALAELRAALDTLRARDDKRLRQFYASKEMLEYMTGLLLVYEERYDEARDAFGRALTENLAFPSAHVRLAELALQRGEGGAAAAEYEQAVQLQGNDPLVRHDYAVALMHATPSRYADAEAQLRKAIELDPDFPTSYFNLAVALAHQNKRDEAIAQYRAFIAHAPRKAAQFIEDANRSIAALESAPASVGTNR